MKLLAQIEELKEKHEVALAHSEARLNDLRRIQAEKTHLQSLLDKAHVDV